MTDQTAQVDHDPFEDQYTNGTPDGGMLSLDAWKRRAANLINSFSDSGEQGLRVNPIPALPMAAYDTYEGLDPTGMPSPQGGTGLKSPAADYLKQGILGAANSVSDWENRQWEGYAPESSKRLYNAFSEVPRLNPLIDVPFSLQEGLDRVRKQQGDNATPAPSRSNPIGTGIEVVNQLINPFAGKPSPSAQNYLENVAPAVGMLAGPSAKTANLDKLNAAKSMQAAGHDADTIFKETGWFQHPLDQKWRFEIPDNGAIWKGPDWQSVPLGKARVGQASEFLDHPELFNAYPELRESKLEYFRPNPANYGPGEIIPGGAYDPESRHLAVRADAPETIDPRSVSLHEFQHAIQQREGFATPLSPYQEAERLEDTTLGRFMPSSWVDGIAFNRYRRNAAEVEARNVQTRRDMTPDERRETPPWETQSHPFEKQIVRENASGPAYIFAGPRARSADLKAMDRAKELEAAGRTRDDIWRETGWFRGIDGRWRFEIPDDKLDLRRVNENPKGYRPTTFSAFAHPMLKRAYEFPERIQGSIGPSNEGAYVQAARDFDPDTMHPVMRTGYIRAKGRSPADAKSTLAHELQHAVQMREGFTPGGSPELFTPEQVAGERARLYQELEDNPDDIFGVYQTHPSEARVGLYERLAGEVEARNVEKRLNMTPEERRAKPPWETEDVPFEQQIVRLLRPQLEPREPVAPDIIQELRRKGLLE
jgi:hypothetical protein